MVVYLYRWKLKSEKEEQLKKRGLTLLKSCVKSAEA